MHKEIHLKILPTCWNPLPLGALLAVWQSAGFAIGRLQVRTSAWSTSHSWYYISCKTIRYRTLESWNYRRCPFRTKDYSAFHPSGVGKWVPVIAGKAKVGVAHSDCGWTCGCAGKTAEIPWEHAPYLRASAVVFHYKEALYQVYAPLPFTLTFTPWVEVFKVIRLLPCAIGRWPWKSGTHTNHGLSRRFRRISRMTHSLMSKHSNTGCTCTSTDTAGKWRYRWRRGNRAGTGSSTRSTIHGGSRVALLLMGVHADLRRTGATTGHATKNVHSRIWRPCLVLPACTTIIHAGDTIVFELYKWAMTEMTPLQHVWGYGFPRWVGYITGFKS